MYKLQLKPQLESINFQLAIINEKLRTVWFHGATKQLEAVDSCVKCLFKKAMPDESTALLIIIMLIKII